MTKELLAQELSQLLSEPKSQVVLVTTSSSGETFAAADAEVVVAEGGVLFYREYLESSRTAHDLTHSIWCDRPVVLSVVAKGRHLHVRGLPVRVHITGPVYLREYVDAEKRGTDELASVWELRVEEIIDVTPSRLRAHERKYRPFFTHLDRLVKSA
jgi:hypothetical protein